MRERLEHQSRTDALTGLFNRRYFDQQLLKEFRLAERYQQPVSLVLFDIDRFKRFNDQYGHEMGDRVLQRVAEVVRQLLRPVDLLCRYGGEEFALLMPGMALSAAINQGEQVRLAVADVEVDGVRVTCSLGVAAIPAAQIDCPETLVKVTDQALYRAKQNGRNRLESLLDPS